MAQDIDTVPRSGYVVRPNTDVNRAAVRPAMTGELQTRLALPYGEGVPNNPQNSSDYSCVTASICLSYPHVDYLGFS